VVVVVGGLVVVVLGGDVGVLARLPSGPGRAEVTGDFVGAVAPRLAVGLVEHELTSAAAAAIAIRPNLRPPRRRPSWSDLIKTGVVASNGRDPS
jgi:hypothetical protein